jgi:lysophospholipid acyltransferase (LPLAT)-like uncharacterized protein
MLNNLSVAWRTFAGELVYLYHWLTMRTASWHVEGKANVAEARANGRPLLFTFWHGQTPLFIMYGHRFMDPSRFSLVMVGDERQDVLARLARRIGAAPHAVDMQGNPVAAGRATLQVVKALRQGRDSMIAPDGPDGPAYEPKAGVAFLAQKAEANIMPVGVWTRQAYQRKRWDRYMIPYPFARIKMVFGRPIPVDKGNDSTELLAQTTEALHEARNRAQELAGITPWR